VSHLVAHLAMVLDVESSNHDAYQRHFFVPSLWLILHTSVSFELHVKVQTNDQRMIL
jgi:hypothetical protein